MPYQSPDDERLAWLKNVFVKYLESWQQLLWHVKEITPLMTGIECFCHLKPMKASK